MFRFCSKVILGLTLTLVTGAGIGAAQDPLVFANDRLKVRLIPRTPDQMAAFYEARGFPEDMIALIREQCFITVGIRNKSKDVLWLEVDNWRFQSANGPIERYGRAYWKKLWRELQAPMPSQATFRWTLLPEVLDFRPDEAEGGNIILNRVSTPFSVRASFAVGKDKHGGRVNVQFDNVRCAEDPKR